MQAFHARVNGRLFRITPLESFPVGEDDFVPVDCRDVRSAFESQAIVEAVTAKTPGTLIADGQVRDAIRSAYYSATSHESGRFPVGGDHLPEDFAITLVR
jgi:glutathione S-transferase